MSGALVWLVLGATAQTLTLPDALRLATADAPGTLRVEAEAELERAQARGLTAAHNPELEAERGQHGAELRVSVPIDLDALAHRGAQRAITEAAALRADLGRVAVVVVVADAWLDLYEADTLRAQTERRWGLARRLRDTARARAAAGELDLVEQTMVEAEVVRLEMGLAEAEQARWAAALRLGSLLGQELGDALAPGALWVVPEPAARRTLGPDGSTAEIPAITLARLDAQAAAAGVRAARWSRLPALALNAGWVTDDHGAGSVFGLTLELPIFSPGGAAVDAAAAQARLAEIDLSLMSRETASLDNLLRRELHRWDQAILAWDQVSLSGAWAALDARVTAGELDVIGFATIADALARADAEALTARVLRERVCWRLWGLVGALPAELFDETGSPRAATAPEGR